MPHTANFVVKFTDGVQIAFPGEERVEYESKVLFPLAGTLFTHSTMLVNAIQGLMVAKQQNITK